MFARPDLENRFLGVQSMASVSVALLNEKKWLRKKRFYKYLYFYINILACLAPTHGIWLSQIATKNLILFWGLWSLYEDTDLRCGYVS